ncbi:lysyl-tRNA synthetase class 2 [Panacagrimonas perspica]|uniref:Lysyl-tRNA synthetase class 2 n=1 Tax=Panacagrimonas perspica TaxID=381431 RepID=A0A4R7PE30_9GAMM|nr:EF-P lysine aminoacylase EpmA [Panacagrimonas perspica]TDU32357.1 lysyl-tRNA synthetase class 2 [Panacagrimonas perspica]THD05292.1 EF-P lysine aminoacylase GenX [Panacagrimonas perspica]
MPGNASQDLRFGDALWRPSASLETIKARTELYGSVRAFFSRRGVLEVDTPVMSAHATVDRHIESFAVPGGGWLQTSPEFAMKRLLCAGSGPIFQIAPAFRREERGRHHNPEFRLLEWYRPEWDHHLLMEEVEELFHALGIGCGRVFKRMSYREAFLLHAGLDPFTEPVAALRERAMAGAVPMIELGGGEQDRDAWLDLWMSYRVGPQLGLDAPVFLHDFPASQAALARVRDDDPPVAERFELFWKGLELANGFHELSNAGEQRRRFENDQAWREAQRHVVPPLDTHLLAALQSGLPDCAGVALGLDRLLMLRLGLPELSAAISFDSRRA